jgi:hypothetical protein
MRRRTNAPRGTSLAELLAVLSGLGVAMAIATGLVHTGMRQQSMSRLELERDRVAMRLARDFREDVRQAVVVEVTGEPVDVSLEDAVGKPLVRLSLPANVRVEYQTTAQGLTRLTEAGDRRAHEDYVLGGALRWEAGVEGGCAVLTGCTPEMSATPHMPRDRAPLEVHVVAAMSPGAEAEASLEEATP